MVSRTCTVVVRAGLNERKAVLHSFYHEFHDTQKLVSLQKRPAQKCFPGCGGEVEANSMHACLSRASCLCTQSPADLCHTLRLHHHLARTHTHSIGSLGGGHTRLPAGQPHG